VVNTVSALDLPYVFILYIVLTLCCVESTITNKLI
jgi:hypothetical protein